MEHFPWLAVLVAINVAVVVYHGDPRDMMAQASDLEAQPVVVAQAVATEKPSIEAPIVAAAPTAAVEQAPEPDTTRQKAVVPEETVESVEPQESTVAALARLSDTYNPCGGPRAFDRDYGQLKNYAEARSAAF